MRSIYSIGLLASLLFITGEARPCGGAFGTNYTIQPAQKIVVGYKNGIETYVFNPNFCGKADSFGLILPIPSTLTTEPTLGTTQLYTDLATVAAPTIVTQQQCPTKAAGGSLATGGAGGASNGGGTTVIQRGQVGIFDWALLRATSVDSFTAWLTANGFPFPSSAAVTFQAYVDNGWYFVAFKVSTGGVGGTAGAAGAATAGAPGASAATICGSFGPVSLAFASAPNPVIPARIASVSSTSLSWDIFAVGSTQMRMTNSSPTLMFSGAISAADLTSHPALSQVAQAGDRLTELMLNSVPSADLILEPDPNQADYRRIITQTVYTSSACTGGASTGGSAAKAGSSGALAGGSTNGGVATGGVATGGVATGGVATGGVAIGGSTTGGQPSTGGSATFGGKPGMGGGALSRDGGAPTANANQAGAASSDAESASGCDCTIASLGRGTVPRGIGLAGLLGAWVALLRRRRAKRRG